MMRKQYDVCIVGSGASGSIMAKELSVAGMSVALLEKGDWVGPKGAEAFDELLHQNWRIYQPSLEDDPTYFSQKPSGPEEKSSIGYSYELVGGGTVLYAGAAWRLREKDFRKRSVYGAIPGATLADWPVTYDELEPYYTKAEREIGVSGDSPSDPTEPHRSDRSSLLPPLPLDAYDHKLLAGGKALGLRPFRMAMSISSVTDPKRRFYQCQQGGWCSGHPCMFNAKSSVDVRILPVALETGRCDLLTNTIAIRVETDDRGLCTGVLCRNRKTREEFRVNAKIVVVAAGAVQTARLLFMSASKLFPQGLANTNGLLGKNLMFHIYSKQLGVFDEPFPFKHNKLIAFHDFYHPGKNSGFINHCSIQSGSKWGPMKLALSKRGWGRKWMEELTSEYARTQLLQPAVEDLPQLRNEVTLHPTEKDLYGVPCPKVTHEYHEMDRKALEFTIARCAEILKACGAKLGETAKAHSNINQYYTFHLLGTARMGHSEKDSVLDRYCRAHAVKNLFVTDGSCFPTSAAVNPTLTIQANTYRVAEHIVAQAKAGAFGSAT